MLPSTSGGGLWLEQLQYIIKMNLRLSTEQRPVVIRLMFWNGLQLVEQQFASLLVKNVFKITAF